MAGFKYGKNFAREIFVDAVIGIVAIPFMTVPILSSIVACAYVKTVGENYLKALISVIHLSSDKRMADDELVKERLKEELFKLKK